MEYPVGLVGERSYQSAVRRCRPGMVAEILHEADNPHDPLALRVDVRGSTVGYIGKTHWLRDAIHEQGKMPTAIVAEMNDRNGKAGLVISVSLAGKGAVPQATASSRPKRQKQPSAAKAGGLLSMLTMLFKAMSSGSGRKRR